ncbi:MAG: hypothetical protein GY757_56830, partial [bacterium]|nr:hypothetical protein [bacterium]
MPIKSVTRSTLFLFLFLFLLMISMSYAGLDENDNVSISETNFNGVLGSGARAFGMGGAFIAVADDATAASWNPAGLAQLEKMAISSVSRIQSYRKIVPASGDNLDFTGPQEISALSLVGPEFVSFTYPIRLGKVKIVPQISYQRGISFSLDSRTNNVRVIAQEENEETELMESWSGSKNETQFYTGGLDTLSFSLGTKILKRVNVGVSVNLWMKGYKGKKQEIETLYLDDEEAESQSEKVIHDTEDLSVELKKGFNFNVGVLVELNDNLKIGAVYKSNFIADIHYSLDILERTSVDDMVTLNRPFSEEQHLKLNWPETMGIGIAYRPTNLMTISMD